MKSWAGAASKSCGARAAKAPARWPAYCKAAGPSALRNWNFAQKSGRILPVRIRAAALHGADGEVIGGVEAFQDISEIKGPGNGALPGHFHDGP